MRYVSPEYQQRLDNLAELLVTKERFNKSLGQAALFEVVELPEGGTDYVYDQTND